MLENRINSYIENLIPSLDKYQNLLQVLRKNTIVLLLFCTRKSLKVS